MAILSIVSFGNANRLGLAWYKTSVKDFEKQHPENPWGLKTPKYFGFAHVFT